MSDATVRVKHEGAACILTLDRPEKRNAIGVAALRAAAEAVRSAESASRASTVIVTGGGGCFSAGADLDEALAVRTAADAKAFFGEWHALTKTLETLRLPVVAAIEGVCLTGGLELALACDIRIAGDGSRFAMTSARIGTVAGAGGTQRLPRIVGRAKALEMLLGAEPIDAAEALRIGLVNRVVPAGRALEEALRLAALYATRAPLALASAKRAVHQGMQTDLATGLRIETELAAEIYESEDKQEGICAFLEKREPRFRGR